MLGFVEQQVIDARKQLEVWLKSEPLLYLSALQPKNHSATSLDDQPIYHAKATREQIPFMWLAAGVMLDFRTLNHFRKHLLGGAGIKVISRRLWNCSSIRGWLI